MEKLKKRGFTGYSPGFSDTSFRTASSHSAHSAELDERSDEIENISDPLAAFDLPSQIHPENLVGVAGVSNILAKSKKVEQQASPPPQAPDEKTTVAERAAALARKKEEEARIEQLAREDREAWGDNIPPPQQVVEEAFLSAMPRADDLLGSLEISEIQQHKSSVPINFDCLEEITMSGRVVELDPGALQLLKVVNAFDMAESSSAEQQSQRVSDQSSESRQKSNSLRPFARMESKEVPSFKEPVFHQPTSWLLGSVQHESVNEAWNSVLEETTSAPRPQMEKEAVAPFSVTDPVVIKRLSDTPGWGVYAAKEKKLHVEEQRRGMFSMMGSWFQGGSSKEDEEMGEKEGRAQGPLTMVQNWIGWEWAREKSIPNDNLEPTDSESEGGEPSDSFQSYEKPEEPSTIIGTASALRQLGYKGSRVRRACIPHKPRTAVDKEQEGSDDESPLVTSSFGSEPDGAAQVASQPISADLIHEIFAAEAADNSKSHLASKIDALFTEYEESDAKQAAPLVTNVMDRDGILKAFDDASDDVSAALPQPQQQDRKNRFEADDMQEIVNNDPMLKQQQQELERQQAALKEARERALMEEENIRKEEMRVAAARKQEQVRQEILEEENRQKKYIMELEAKRRELEQERESLLLRTHGTLSMQKMQGAERVPMSSQPSKQQEEDAYKMQMQMQAQKEALEMERRKMEIEQQQQKLEIEKERMKLEKETLRRKQKEKEAQLKLEKERMERERMEREGELARQQAQSQYYERPAPSMAPSRQNDSIQRWLESSVPPSVAAGSVAPGRKNLDQPRPISMQDVQLWLQDIGMFKYARMFADNEIDGEMLLTLTDKDLAEIGVPAWTGDRQRILVSVQALVDPSLAPVIDMSVSSRNYSASMPPAPSVFSAARSSLPAQPSHFPSDGIQTPVGEWLASIGFGRFRTLFADSNIHELRDLAQMGGPDLLQLGIPEAGGQLGRLQASIQGLRYTLQAGGATGGDERWETETVSTTATSKSGKGKRGKSKERKALLDFSLLEEFVEVSDIYAQRWSKMTAHLEANELRLYKGHKAPVKGDKPKTLLRMDGLIIDESDKKANSVFVVKSLFASSTGDMLIALKDAQTTKLWKQRLQGASFFHNMPREKQLAGLAKKPVKAAESKQTHLQSSNIDQFGNRISQKAASESKPAVVPKQVETSSRRASQAVSVERSSATKAPFNGPVKSFTIKNMIVRNASQAFDDPVLVVGVYGHGGGFKFPFADIPLKVRGPY
eukprot:754694-Hanusia_phi.AAC.2